MNFFQRLFGRRPTPDPDVSVGVSAAPVSDGTLAGWEALPGFIPADPADYEQVSVIATAIAAGDRPESEFLVKRIWQRNPEALQVALIASSLAALDDPDSQLAVKRIYKKTSSV